MTDNPHVYRHLALHDLFHNDKEVTAWGHLLHELDALEELGWVEERKLGVYTLTEAGYEAFIMDDIGCWAEGNKPPAGFTL